MMLLTHCMAPYMPCSRPPNANPNQEWQTRTQLEPCSLCCWCSSGTQQHAPSSGCHGTVPMTPGSDYAPSYVSSPPEKLTRQQLELLSCLVTQHLFLPHRPTHDQQHLPHTPTSKQRQDCRPHCQVHRAVHHQRFRASQENWRVRA
jgi:hypothetical protein